MKYFHQTKAFLDAREEVKNLANKIHTLKKDLHEAQRKNVAVGDIMASLITLRFFFRHKNIALALVKGKKREQIERPSKNNLPNERKIEEFYKAIIKSINDEIALEKARSISLNIGA